MSSSSSRSSSPLSVLSRSPSPPPGWADSLVADTITVAAPVKRGPGRRRKVAIGTASSFVAASPSDPPHTKKEKGCTATVLEHVTSQRCSNRITKLKKKEPELVRGAAPVVCGKRKRGSDDLYQDEVSTTKRSKCVEGADLVLAALAQEPPTAPVVTQKRKRRSIDSAQENDSDYTSKSTKVASAQNQVIARAERRRKRLTQEELAAEEDIALYKSKSTILQNLARAGPEDLPSYGRIGTSPPPDRGGSSTPEPLPPVIADLGFVVGSASTSQKRLDLSKKGLSWDGDVWNGEWERWSQQRVHKKSGIPYAKGAAKGKHPPIDMK